MTIVNGIVGGINKGIVQGFLGSEGEVFSPDNIAGLLAWYDASDTDSITASGANVSQINDKSGNDEHLQQGVTNNMPQTGTKTQNGLNVLEFAGNDYLSLDGTVAATALTGIDATDCTIFMTLNELSSDTGNDAAICMKSTVGSDLYTIKLGTLDRTYVFGTTSGNFQYETPALGSEDTFNTIVITMGSNGINIWVNGTKTEVTGTAPSGITWDAFWVARRYNGFLSTLDLGELAFYNGVLPQADIDALNGYGANKWST